MLSHTFLATQLRTATDSIKRALAAIEADAFEGAEDGQRIPQRCTRPPAGWTCSLAEGHEGPCAALPVPPKSLADVQLEQLFGRVAALEQIVLAISEDACSKHGLYPF